MTFPNMTPAGMPTGSNPVQGGQQGQQQQLHPTVTYGQPGGQQAQVIPPGQPMPRQDQGGQQFMGQPNYPQGPGSYPPTNLPPAPAQPQFAQPGFPPQGSPPQGYQPGAAPGFPPGAAAQQPQPGYGAPQGAPVAPRRYEMTGDEIMDGPGVPPELRGRTMRQISQIYGALAVGHLTGQQPGQAPQRPQPAPQRQEPQGQPAGERQQSGGAAVDFWRDPMGALERAIDSRLAPITQATTTQQVMGIRQNLAANVPDFAILEPEVVKIFQEAGAGPQQLGDVNSWIQAMDLARGRLVGRGQYHPAQVPNNVIPAPNAQRGPGASVPAQQPVQPYAFFTEAPTPPSQQAVRQLTPEQQYYARKMGMTDEDYMAWQGGVVPSTPTRRW